MRIVFRLLFVGLLFAALGAERTSANCPPSFQHTKIYFVNGIDTGEDDAKFAATELDSNVRARLSELGLGAAQDCLEPTDYSYNKNEALFLDFLEAADQLLIGEMSKFWRFLAGLGAAPDTLQQLAADTFRTIDADRYVIDSDLMEFVDTYSTAIRTLQHKVILVSHSQGNFYANQAVRILTTDPSPVDDDSIDIVAVATPASFVEGGGPYVTRAFDIILTVPLALPANAPFESCGGPFDCHKFLESYLAKPITRVRILDHVIAAIPIPPSLPTLLTPINNAVIPQNDPIIGCPLHPTAGYGLRVRFDWTDSFSPNGISGYEIVGQLQGAPFPIVNTFVPGSELTLTRCNSFVTDANLQGWEWRVRAQDTLGNVSEWTPNGMFQFAPCRLESGVPCGSVVPPPTPADLTITKTASPNPVASGGTLTYTITVQNVGGSPADNVTVTDPLPAGVSFVSCNASVGGCSAPGGIPTALLGTLAVGGSATVTISTTAPTVASSTTKTNTASVSTTTVEPNTANNQAFQTTTVNPSAPISQLSFSRQTYLSFLVGNPVSIVAADFDADSKLDLVLANEGFFANTVSILLGNGDGTFRSLPDLVGSVLWWSDRLMAAGELNGDGNLDLAVGSGSGVVSIFLGNGDGTFGPRVDLTSGGSGYASVALGDLNSDGKLDLAVANLSSGFSALFGNGDGTFGTAQTVMSAGTANWVLSGDFNNDGKVDLAVPTGILAGRGDGTFAALIPTPLGGEWITSGDFNNDGKLDVAGSMIAINSNAVGIQLGNGDGTFRSMALFEAGARGPLTVGDFNGDGKLDLAVIRLGFTSANDSIVSILLGNGDGTFGAPLTFATGGGASSVVAGDFNGDGKLDLAIGTANAGLTILLNTSN